MYEVFGFGFGLELWWLCYCLGLVCDFGGFCVTCLLIWMFAALVGLLVTVVVFNSVVVRCYIYIVFYCVVLTLMFVLGDCVWCVLIGLDDCGWFMFIAVFLC